MVEPLTEARQTMEVRHEATVEALDGLVTRLIGHAHMAKAYREAVDRDPGLRGGFGKLARKHAEALVTLGAQVGDMAAALANAGAASPRLTVVAGQR